MPDTSRTGDVDSVDLEEHYLAQAAQRVAELTPDRPAAKGVDVEAVQNRIHRALEDDATHELRELVSKIRGGLEMAQLNSGDDGRVVVDRQRAEKMMAALDRAEALVETHLDPATVRRLMVTLEPESFGLSRHLTHFLTSYGVDIESPRVRSYMAEVTVTADRDKVVKGLGHVALHLWQRAGADAVLVVDSRPAEDGDGARGHLGLDPPPFEREDLVEELDQPFALASLEIDVPYVRAVLERHGGGLHVAEAPGGGLGYGFELPGSPLEVTG